MAAASPSHLIQATCTQCLGAAIGIATNIYATIVHVLTTYVVFMGGYFPLRIKKIKVY